MNDRQLRYAHAVWREHSFSKASERLCVSQPSLSDQVRMLEEEIGFELFQRTNYGVHPTLLGRTFLKEVDRVVQNLLELKEFAVQLNGAPGAQLRIGIATGLAALIAAPVVARLRRDAPRLRPSLVVASPRRLVRLIENGRIDIGIALRVPDEATPVSVAVQPIAEAPLVALGPFGDSTPISLEELAQRPLIVHDAVAGFGASLTALFRDSGLSPEVVAHCDDLAGVRAMVAAGMGLAVAPRLMLAAACEGDPLVAAREIDRKISLRVELLRGVERLSPRLEAQVEPTTALINSLVSEKKGTR